MSTTVAAEDHRRLIATSTPGIYRRGTRYAYRYTDASGRTRQGSARTLAEARRLKAQRATDAARGERHETSRLTLAVYANEWLSSYQGRTSRGIRVETLADYRHELGLYALPLLGGLRLGEIEPRHVKQLAALVSDGGRRKPRTVKLAIAPLRALLATAVEDGLIRSNPAAGVRIAQPDTLEEDLNHVVQERALTPEQLARLIAEIPESHRPFVTFVAQTGLRIGEAIAVQWRDVDLDAGLLHIRRRYYRSAYAPPKTRHGRRVLPLTPAMAALLRSRRHLLAPRPDGARLAQPHRSAPQSGQHARSRAQTSRVARRGPVGLMAHPETHLRHAPVPRGLEHQSRSALPRSSLGCLHPGGLRALPSRGHAQQRVSRQHRRYARPTVGG